KSAFIFKALKASGAHIAALQEVYNSQMNPQAALPAAEGYAVHYGRPIKININNVAFRYEYCPIAYRPDVLNCTDGDTSQTAHTHWVSCKIDKVTPEIEFYFGCAHLSTTASGISGDLTQLVRMIAPTPPPATPNTRRPTI